MIDFLVGKSMDLYCTELSCGILRHGCMAIWFDPILSYDDAPFTVFEYLQWHHSGHKLTKIRGHKVSSCSYKSSEAP